MIHAYQEGFKRDYTIFAIDAPRKPHRKFGKKVPYESGNGLICLNAKKEFTEVSRIHVPFTSPDGSRIEVPSSDEIFFFGGIKQLTINKNARDGVLDMYREHEDLSNGNPSGGNVEIPIVTLDLDIKRKGMIKVMIADILSGKYELLSDMELKTERGLTRLPLPKRYKYPAITNGRAFCKKYKLSATKNR